MNQEHIAQKPSVPNERFAAICRQVADEFEAGSLNRATWQTRFDELCDKGRSDAEADRQRPDGDQGEPPEVLAALCRETADAIEAGTVQWRPVLRRLVAEHTRTVGLVNDTTDTHDEPEFYDLDHVRGLVSEIDDLNAKLQVLGKHALGLAGIDATEVRRLHAGGVWATALRTLKDELGDLMESETPQEGVVRLWHKALSLEQTAPVLQVLLLEEHQRISEACGESFVRAHGIEAARRSAERLTEDQTELSLARAALDADRKAEES